MPLLKRRDQPRSRVGQHRVPMCVIRRSTDPTGSSLGDYGQPVHGSPSEQGRDEIANTVVGYVEHLGGRELEQARQLVATATHRVSIQPGLCVQELDAFEIKATGEVLEIGYINDVEERKRGLVFICSSQRGQQ